MKNTAEEKFLFELNIFRNEVDSALKSLYTELTVHEILSKDKKTLKLFNYTPTFWNTVLNGLQHSTFIILGRIMDSKGKYTLLKLFKLIETNKEIFSLESFEDRFRKDFDASSVWYKNYLQEVYVLEEDEILKLSKYIDSLIKEYIKLYRPVRDHFGHKIHGDNEEIKAVFDVVKIRDLEKFCLKLKFLHEGLWQLYHNGRGPLLPLRTGKYSTKQLLKNNHKCDSFVPVNEQIVKETKKALEIIKKSKI